MSGVGNWCGYGGCVGSGRATTAGVVAGAGHMTQLVPQVVCQKRDANWQASSREVARVLHQTERAGSAVECMNSERRVQRHGIQRVGT